MGLWPGDTASRAYFLNAVTTDTCHSAWLFTWMLETQARVLILAQQVVY